jgi:hypothetical protein
MTLKEYSKEWKDTPEYHEAINLSFEGYVNADEKLKEHRDFVEGHVYGFGQRAFWWLWKILVDELPKEPKMLEIGVFKCATLSLWQLLNHESIIYGVSPMNGEGLDWKADYYEPLRIIHDRYKQTYPVIIEGLSEDKEVIIRAENYGEYDCVYIDGGHARRHIDNDMQYYAPMVKPSGYLVIDDCANDLNMKFGYFQGINDVTDGVVDYMKDNDEWEFVFSVVHIKVFRRK